MSRGVLTVLTLLFALTVFAAAESFAAGKKRPQYLMGVIGDSITAATLADTQANWVPLGEILANPDEDLLRDLLRSNGPRFLIQNKSTFSWASGRSVNSHYMRLKNHLKQSGDPGELSVLNVAVPGETYTRAWDQAVLITQAMESGIYDELKYVTLFMGSNDACTPGSESDEYMENMYGNIKMTLWQLAKIKQKQPIPVLVSGLPRIPLLGRPEIREHQTVGGYTCEVIRSQVLKFCNSLTHWNSEEEFNDHMRNVLEKNELIRHAVEEASAQFHTLDIRFTDRVTQAELTTDILAMDCFHPDRQGQDMISETLWSDQPWFR